MLIAEQTSLTWRRSRRTSSSELKQSIGPADRSRTTTAPRTSSVSISRKFTTFRCVQYCISLLYVAFFWHVLGLALASFLLPCCRILIPADLTQGPIRCEDSTGVPAMPGDLLVVELCEVSLCVHVCGLRLCGSKSHTIYLNNPDVV